MTLLTSRWSFPFWPASSRPRTHRRTLDRWVVIIRRLICECSRHSKYSSVLFCVVKYSAKKKRIQYILLFNALLLQRELFIGLSCVYIISPIFQLWLFLVHRSTRQVWCLDAAVGITWSDDDCRGCWTAHFRNLQMAFNSRNLQSRTRLLFRTGLERRVLNLLINLEIPSRLRCRRGHGTKYPLLNGRLPKNLVWLQTEFCFFGLWYKLWSDREMTVVRYRRLIGIWWINISTEPVAFVWIESSTWRFVHNIQKHDVIYSRTTAEKLLLGSKLRYEWLDCRRKPSHIKVVLHVVARNINKSVTFSTTL